MKKVFKMKNLKLIAIIIFIIVFMALILTHCKNSTKENATTLILTNKSDSSVVVYLTLGSDTNYVTDVNGIFGITTSGLQGSFILESGDSVNYTSSNGKGFAGNISFNTPPLNCPDSNFTFGVNIFEFALNNNFIGIQNAQETIDISCVAGVNCRIGCSIDSLGGWNAGETETNFSYFSNTFIYNNVGRIGVYPFGCDVCTGTQNPPSCSNELKPSQPQTEAICNVQRDATKKGGKVIVEFLGNLNGVPCDK